MRVFISVLGLLFSLALASASEGELIFKNSCQRCHLEGSKKPLSYLKQKYKGKPEAVMELARNCPWGKGLSQMEIELVSRWLAGLQ